MPDSPALVGSTQAARIIGIDKSTLSRWAQDGRITVAAKLPKRNGAALFTEEEVERVRSEYQSRSTPAPEAEGVEQ